MWTLSPEVRVIEDQVVPGGQTLESLGLKAVLDSASGVTERFRMATGAAAGTLWWTRGVAADAWRVQGASNGWS